MSADVSEEVKIQHGVVRLVRGDITELEVDAFVFYAQPDLALGTGFGTAISLRGGPGVQKELDELQPVADCQAVVGSAGKLKATSIIHAVGPRFNEEDIEGKLRETMRNSLQAAEKAGAKSVAFPAMGAGFYGVPLDLCARVMLDTIQECLQGETPLEQVVVCVLDQREFAPFQSQFASLK